MYIVHFILNIIEVRRIFKFDILFGNIFFYWGGIYTLILIPLPSLVFVVKPFTTQYNQNEYKGDLAAINKNVRA